MASVFLSYSREDTERIGPLAAALEKAGHKVWWDREIAGGEEFSGVIEQALESADVVVVAWTSRPREERWIISCSSIGSACRPTGDRRETRPTSAAMRAGRAIAALLERSAAMRRFAILLLMGLIACGRQADRQPQQPAKVPTTSAAAAQSAMPAKTSAAMRFMAVPKDKAQLDRLLAMGYTVHNDHMHPPGVKECPLDKAGASVVQ